MRFPGSVCSRRRRVTDEGANRDIVSSLVSLNERKFEPLSLWVGRSSYVVDGQEKDSQQEI